MKKILVLCTGNSCRSQIAEGYLKYFAGKKAEIYSAGIQPHGLNPRAIKTMAEDDIDISKQTSNDVNEYKNITFDFVITVCDNADKNCPVLQITGKKLYFDLFDPAKATGSEEEICAAFRQVREMIKSYCKDFVKKYC